jgi:hypothetical protein
MEMMEKVQKCEVQEQSYVPSSESFKVYKDLNLKFIFRMNFQGDANLKVLHLGSELKENSAFPDLTLSLLSCIKLHPCTNYANPEKVFGQCI